MRVRTGEFAMQSIKGLPVGTVNTVTEKTATKPQITPRGMDLLNHQLLNKSTAFTEKERSKCGLHGLLPPHVESLKEQVVRAYEAYQRKDDVAPKLAEDELRRRVLAAQWTPAYPSFVGDRIKTL